MSCWFAWLLSIINLILIATNTKSFPYPSKSYNKTVHNNYSTYLMAGRFCFFFVPLPNDVMFQFSYTRKVEKKDRCWLYHKITIDDVMIIVYGQQQRNRTENMTRRKMLSNSSTSSSIEIICWGVLLLMLLLLNCLCCSLLHAWLVGAHSTTTCDDDLISLHVGFLFVPFENFMRVNHLCI